MKNKLRDRRFIAEIAAFMLLLYGVCACVYLNGDDFMYGAFAHGGILANVADYYFTGNGRFWINILDSALLWFDRYGFMVLLPWIALAFVVLLAKNVVHIMADAADRRKEKDLVRMGMVLFACLDVMCLRETVFWITGMMNYLFPAVVFLLAYLMFRKSADGVYRGVGLLGYYVVCFLAASSVEQFALMFVGMMTLHHGYDLLRRRHIPARQWTAYVIALAGLALLILAPGNFQRVDEQQMPSLAENLWSLLYQDTVHDVAVPYLLMLSLTGAWIGTQADNRIVSVYMRGVPPVILAVLCTPLADKAAALLGLILLWVIQMIMMFALLRQRCKPEFLFLCVVGVGSQVMLLISAVWGFRCMLSLYMVYMLLIGCLSCYAGAKVTLAVLACGIAAALHPVLAAALGIVLVLLYRKGRPGAVSRTANAAVYLGTALALVILVVGYAGNVGVYEENLDSTRNPREQTVILKELPNDTYSWYPIPMGEFHETYYRQLYGIADEIRIVYEAQPRNDG